MVPDPAYDVPAYGSTALARPAPAARLAAGGADRAARAALRRPAGRPGRRGPHPQRLDGGGRAASHSASGSTSRAGCWAATGGPIAGQLVEIWQANAAGRYAHEVDQHPAPLDPNFAGRGPDADRRRGPLPLHDDQARRLPVAQPPQRLAAGPHPLLGVRPRLHRAARHPDVLPRRPAAGPRPDRRLGARPGRPRPAGLRTSTGTRPSRSGPSATTSTSWSATTSRRRRHEHRRRRRHDTGGGHERPGADAVADRRAVLRLRPRPGRRADLVPPGSPGAVCVEGRVLDGAGEAVPDAVVELWQADAGGGFPEHRGWGFGRCLTDTARALPLHDRQARAGRRPSRPPTSTCRSSPAACCSASSPACTSPTRRPPTPPTRCSRAVDDPARRATLVARAGARRVAT